LLGLLSGCVQSSVNEEPPAPDEVEVNGDKTDHSEEDVEDNTEEAPLHEWTEEEKSLLAIDNDKIIFSTFDFEKVEGDAVGFLLNRYPDAVLVSKVYFDKDRFGEDVRDEIWRIEPAGLTYYAQYFINGNEINGKSNFPMNWIVKISGRADGLITGLIAPIETTELMERLCIPEKVWSESQSLGYSLEAVTTLYNEVINRVQIVIPDPSNEREAVGIKIKISNSGYISPEDEIELHMMIWAP